MKRDQLIFIGVLLVGALVAVVIVLATGGDDSDGSSEDLTKPEVEVPTGPAPKQLQVNDITEGEGPEARPGDTLSVQYVGVDYATGKEFDSSWDSGQPFTFQLGGGQVIRGWDQGIAGMKAGGRRELIVPPDLGYGKQGQPPAIKPNETLVFVVDLLGIQPGAAG